jgi:hypothetical protein
VVHEIHIGTALHRVESHGIIMFLQFLFVCRILILGYNIFQALYDDMVPAFDVLGEKAFFLGEFCFSLYTCPSGQTATIVLRGGADQVLFCYT